MRRTAETGPVACTRGTSRPRRPPEQRQVEPVQRAHRRRRPSSPRTRSRPPRPRWASRTCPTSASTGWARCRTRRSSCTPSFEIVDIAALVKGASTGEGLGNRFLGSLRDCDAILYVLRAFEDPSVLGDADPRGDLDTLELELVLADLASVEGRLDRQQRAAKGDKSLAGEIAALERAARGPRRRHADLPRRRSPTDERELLAPAFLLTDKPVLVGREHRRGPARRRSTTLAAQFASRRRRRARRCACSSRPRRRMLDAGGARRAARRPRARRGRGAARRARRVPPARPAHVPHHRRHRVAGVDVPRRRQGARVRGRDPLRPAARASSAPR